MEETKKEQKSVAESNMAGAAEKPAGVGLKFGSIKEFRSTATEKDYRELEEYILKQPQKAKAFPNEAYGFSYSAAAAELRSRGYLQEAAGRSQTEVGEYRKPFEIHSGEVPRDTEQMARTVSLSRKIWNRIDTLAEENWVYSKKMIIVKLFDEAVKQYGY